MNDHQRRQHSGWLRTAVSSAVVKRALAYALGVGALLIAINHGDAILAGRLDASRLFKMALTVLVPYCVSTASSVGATLARPPCHDRETIAEREAERRESVTAAEPGNDDGERPRRKTWA